MTIADEIRLEAFEIATYNAIKGLTKNGASVEFIAKSFEMPLEKVEEIISKIKTSYN
jgi:hypothetical protein